MSANRSEAKREIIRLVEELKSGYQQIRETGKQMERDSAILGENLKAIRKLVGDYIGEEL